MPFADLLLPHSLSGRPSVRSAVVVPVMSADPPIRTISPVVENGSSDEKVAENNMRNTSESEAGVAVPVTESKTRTGQSFVVSWKNLTYTISSSDESSGKKRQKTILNNVTGQMRSGELTGLMGPSGAGKSTLLECIAGIRRDHRFGQVTLSGPSKVRVAFVPQEEHFFHLLTVREALTFACKFRLQNQNSAQTSLLVQDVMQQLNLLSCQKNRIASCSGGQRKRLSIGQELIVRPQILILDEPTSGLDSVSCFHTVSLLKQVCEQSDPPVGVICTMHQPSATILSLFHMLYALSTIGRCVYSGPPSQLVAWFTRFQLPVPSFTSPADFLIQVATGEQGLSPLKLMVLEQERLSHELLFSQSVDGQHDSDSVFHHETDLDDAMEEPDHPLLSHVWLQVHRSFLFTARDLTLGVMRLVAAASVGLFIGYLYSESSVGSSAACPASDSETDGQGFGDRLEQEQVSVVQNLGLWFFSLIFVQFTSLVPTVLTFPVELQAFSKERRNGWYSTLSYYAGKTLSDLPFQVACPLIYCSIVYFMTRQSDQWFRFVDVCVSAVLLSLVAQSHGILFAACFMSDIQTGMFVAPVSSIPMIVFSGFLIRLQSIPYYLRLGSYLSYLRYSFDMVIVSLYGNRRCGPDAVRDSRRIRQRLQVFLTGLFTTGLSDPDSDLDQDKEEKMRVANMTHSLVTSIVNQFSGKIETVDGQEVTGVMAEFRLSDSDFDSCLFVLIFYFLVLRILAFFVIRWKSVIRK